MQCGLRTGHLQVLSHFATLALAFKASSDYLLVHMIVHFELTALAFSPGIKLLSCPGRDLRLRSKSAACLAAVLLIIGLKQPKPHLITINYQRYIDELDEKKMCLQFLNLLARSLDCTFDH